jgi:hypothetical protein
MPSSLSGLWIGLTLLLAVGTFGLSLGNSSAVGAFEGASYEAKGLYRPQADCIMFSRDPVGFCRVCRRAIDRIIDLYSR